MGAEMLTKFESKSSRVKGVAFHPKRPWLLCSLHNGTIQLWDYRIGALLNRFEEHDGPVRAVDFHPSKPIFASGGDDYKIRVWGFKHVLFTLSGHLDYVRTVQFHHEYPWILSCGDDQTIRIWNWQSRSCIAILTGHNHYVMCAQFHPKEDLIASASLDQTVRVWDISGLRKKNAAPSSVSSFEEQFSARSYNAPAGTQAADMFGNTDAIVKYVLEGHDRGVNWVSFHHTLPLIISAGDDRLIKIWRMSETKAWEVDTCRGHFNNVSTVLFHPKQDLILSCGEDKTIRLWDANKRTAVQSFRRESDRFWIVAAHPNINLFAAGHDNGVMVFKLERERPAYVIHQNILFFVNKEKFVRSYDFNTLSESQSLVSLRKLGQPWIPPRSISYNPSERAVLVSSPTDGGVYELVNLPREGSGGLAEASDSKRGTATTAVFVARNRFAVFNKEQQQIDIKDLSNSVTKTITPLPLSSVNDIHFGGVGNLLLTASASVVLYEIQKKEVLAELTTPLVKYVQWSSDGQHVALLGKHTITIATKALEQVCSIHETIRIKSATWDDSLGVLLYSTLNHVKYLLPTPPSGNDPNPPTGVIRTLHNTVYLVRVKGKNLWCLTREGQVEVINIDPTEYRFKVSLAKKEYSEMVRIIKNSNLVGQSIIGYLQKKGYPEIALQFVQDSQTRFELAIECGNLTVAVETAKELDKPHMWKTLATAALSQGNIQVVEMAYQKLRNFEKLSFLYLITGDRAKLLRMGKIAQHRQDYGSEFQNSLFVGDVESRIRMFKELDLYPLAYATAKTYGLEEECQSILEIVGLTEDQIKLPPNVGQKQIEPPKPLSPSPENWPLLPTSLSIFERALGDQLGDLLLEDNAVVNKYGDSFSGFEDTFKPSSDDLINVGEDGESWEEVGQGDAWDIGDDAAEVEDGIEVTDGGEEEGEGVNEVDLWMRNSPLAADHVAAGSFETAMQLLNRQVGVVNFAPLKPKFLEIYQASRTFLPASPGLPSLHHYVRRTKDETDSRKILPALPGDLETIKSVDLRDAYKLVSGNKLEDAVAQFRSIIHKLLLFAASSKSEADEIIKIVETARQYILGLSTELERRQVKDSTDPKDVKRNLELAAYFSHAQLSPQHKALAYSSAMIIFTKHKNTATAGTFATKLLEGPADAKAKERARKTQTAAQKNPRDEIEIEYDQFAPFSVCAASLTPIYSGSPEVKCRLCGALYKPEYNGTLCKVDEVAQVGASGTGFRVLI